LLSYIDGGWFNILTFVIALALACYKCIRCKHGFFTAATGLNLLHGIAVFPLMVLAVSVFSKEILSSIIDDRLILSVAGAVALFSILEDEFNRDAEAVL